MSVTEQIDALYSMAINPIQYLVTPRIVASLISMPMLTAIFDVVGIFGAYVVGVGILGVSSGSFFSGMEISVVFHDVCSGIFKSVCFGLIITWICCYKGFHAPPMATGVGQATTESVVLCFCLISGLGLLSVTSIMSVAHDTVVDLHKSFGRQKVLKGVNLEFATGKITTIVGTSGCGKTVLLKHLNALTPARPREVSSSTAIDITKLGQNELYQMRQKFGVLFQGAALLDSMTVFDNVGFPLREKTKLSEARVEKKVERPAGTGRLGRDGL